MERQSCVKRKAGSHAFIQRFALQSFQRRESLTGRRE